MQTSASRRASSIAVRAVSSSSEKRDNAGGTIEQYEKVQVTVDSHKLRTQRFRSSV